MSPLTSKEKSRRPKGDKIILFSSVLLFSSKLKEITE